MIKKNLKPNYFYFREKRPPRINECIKFFIFLFIFFIYIIHICTNKAIQNNIMKVKLKYGRDQCDWSILSIIWLQVCSENIAHEENFQNF